MSPIASLESAYKAGDYEKVESLLQGLKVDMAKSGLLTSPNSSTHSKADLEGARTALEIGALAAVNLGKEAEFTRFVAQSRQFYGIQGLSASPHESKIVALYLLLLLSQNEIAQFHTELESLDFEVIENDKFLSFPIKLERWIMEGAYDRVWKAITNKDAVPSAEFLCFADPLVFAIRGEIALCAEKAYTSLPLNNARHLLFFDSDQGVVDFVHEQPGWEIQGERITFPGVVSEDATLNSRKVTERLIGNSLEYAKEMEQII